ncbi:MAG: hypothetical protein KBG48_36075 [Kofleriaceae bacterium]|jgi:hypothetical protein|nr:hypothetical protein [Kofleriaceae bacterium]MBP9172834.1 hypothetical protein [Kofleriaceae bacterium]MBP9861751.1 hypothetical protein [Kofleriaceae bacterium]
MRTQMIAMSMVVAACGGPAAPATPTNSGGAGAGAAATVTPLERVFPPSEEADEIKVRVPRIEVAGNPTASAAINTALGVPATADELTTGGEVGLDYTIGYNGDGLLAVIMGHETMGAYPDSYAEHFVFDTTTGARLDGAAQFRPEATAELVARLDGQLQAALTKTRAERPDCVDGDDDPYQGQYTADHLRHLYLTADRTLVFVYDYDFPHVIQACEPDGELTLPLAEAATYLRADSPLRRALR